MYFCNNNVSCLDSKDGASFLCARVAWMKPSLPTRSRDRLHTSFYALSVYSKFWHCHFFFNKVWQLLRWDITGEHRFMDAPVQSIRSFSLVACVLIFGIFRARGLLSPNSLSPRIFKICSTANFLSSLSALANIVWSICSEWAFHAVDLTCGITRFCMFWSRSLTSDSCFKMWLGPSIQCLLTLIWNHIGTYTPTTNCTMLFKLPKTSFSSPCSEHQILHSLDARLSHLAWWCGPICLSLKEVGKCPLCMPRVIWYKYFWPSDKSLTTSSIKSMFTLIGGMASFSCSSVAVDTSLPMGPENLLSETVGPSRSIIKCLSGSSLVWRAHIIHVTFSPSSFPETG